MRVPGFILRRLYVKGSLRNMPGGFQFQLQNNLGSGQARKLMPLTVDGDEMPMDRSFFTVADGRLPFDAVSEEKTFSLESRDFHATPDSLAAGASFTDRWSWDGDVWEKR